MFGMSSLCIFTYTPVIGYQKDKWSLLQVLCIECDGRSHSYGTHMSGRELQNVVLHPELDEPCGTDRECVTENSRCGDVCRCKVNYIQSRQKDKCLKGNENPFVFYLRKRLRGLDYFLCTYMDPLGRPTYK